MTSQFGGRHHSTMPVGDRDAVDVDAVMREALVERLQKAIAAATDEDLCDGGRYFAETCDDLTRCRHDEIGEYQHSDDGELVELLWNNRALILAALTPENPS